jgi:hypothetical protein
MNTPEDLEYGDTNDYSEIDSKYRIKTFDIEYDEEVIADMQEKVNQSRKYIKQII